MSKKKKQQFIYVFDPVRPELVTDPDAWTEEEIRIGIVFYPRITDYT